MRIVEGRLVTEVFRGCSDGAGMAPSMPRIGRRRNGGAAAGASTRPNFLSARAFRARGGARSCAAMPRRKLLVLDVVGLTLDLLPHAPRIAAVAREGFVAPMDGVLPGVTCTAQATLLTGVLPREHGVVANGWYFRDLAEIWLWRQSNHLVQGPKLLDELAALAPPVTTAKLFWWFNLYSAATWSVTPRPHYPADGRKLPDVHAEPAALGRELTQALGTFPLFDFWGPTASIRSTRWIADAALQVLARHDPDLALVYLPHLDYDLQRFGPADPRIPAQVAAVDAEAGRLIDAARAAGREIVVLSEYGITAVRGAVCVNRVLREAGFLAVRDTPCGELLDAGAARAFAVADHQVAHVYVRRAGDLAAVQRLLARCEGVERVLDEAGKREHGLDHPRSGELVLVAAPTASSPTTTGSTTRRPPTSRAPSTSTASRATTRASSSSRPTARCSSRGSL
jgi:predicted AlkP superfamily pyrophosphatase or phosphodiesterase